MAEEAEDRCECGAALAHVSGAGASGVLCPVCDREHHEELTVDPVPVSRATSAEPTIQDRVRAERYVSHPDVVDELGREFARIREFERGCAESIRLDAESIRLDAESRLRRVKQLESELAAARAEIERLKADLAEKPLPESGEPTERDRQIAAIARDACEDADWPALDRIVSGYRAEIEEKHADALADARCKLASHEKELRMQPVIDQLREIVASFEVDPFTEPWGRVGRLERQLEDARGELAERNARVLELEGMIHTPHVENFLEAVKLEAAHQQERWGTDHDAGKTDADWFWVCGYLAGKVLRPGATLEKKLHHVITTAALCLNWHRYLTGDATRMRPGIATPRGEGVADG